MGLVSINWASPWKYCETEFLPLSVNISVSALYMHTHSFRNNLVIVPALVFDMGRKLIHLDSLSHITSMSFIPLEVTGNGPLTSSDTSTKHLSGIGVVSYGTFLVS
jgi:hypothetical protein